MPVSDYLIALAIALHPHADQKLAVTVSADALSQPAGGARLVLAATTPQSKTEASATPTVAPVLQRPPMKCARSRTPETPKKDGGVVAPMRCAPQYKHEETPKKEGS